MYKKLLIIFLVALSVITLSCKKKSKVSLNVNCTDKLELIVGDTKAIDVTVSGSDNYNIKYSLSKDGIIKMNGNVIEALNPGEVSVTISYDLGEDSHTINVVVKEVPTLSIQGTQYLKIGESFKFSYTSNIDGNPTWLSESPEIATVDNEGNVHAVTSGSCIIVCKIGDVKATYSLTVLKVDPTEINLAFKEAHVFLGDTFQIEHTVNEGANPIVTYSSSDEAIAIVNDKGLVSALNAGECTITLTSIGNKDIQASFKFIVERKNPVSIETVETLQMEVQTTYELKWTVLPSDANPNVRFTSSNVGVAVVTSDGIIKAMKAGTTIIKVISKADSNVYTSFNLTVIQPDATSIVAPDTINIEKDGTYELKYSVEPFNAQQVLDIEIGNDSIISIDKKNVITALTIGESTLTLKAKDGSNLTKEIKVVVEPKDVPEFVFDEGVKQNIVINYNEEFDPLAGIKALDKHDGDLTNKVVVDNPVNNKKYGRYVVKYDVADSSGFTAHMERIITVEWQYQTIFIGHAGSYFGLMNSEAAIRYALEVLHYQAVEIDLAQTSDGVFVLSHDATFGDYTIASTPWSTLKDVEVTQGRNAGIPSQLGMVTGSPYTTKICTLDTYLKLCKEYGAKSVIELKSSNGISNSSQTRMPALMKEIADHDMLDDVIFLGSNYNCLIWTRQNGYDYIECQYLVSSVESQDVLNRCIDWDLDVSTNVTYGGSNSDEWLQKYHDAGLKISTYTFTQYSSYADVQTWLDKKVDYVTCDWHVLDELKHYKKETVELPTYVVTFKDFDGTVLRTSKVKEGHEAIAPKDPTRPGYKFVGWDKDFSNVVEDMDVTALYELDTYTITYKPNMLIMKSETWATKEDFLNEFYTDLFNFLDSKVGKISGLSKSDGKYTFSLNGKTPSWTSVAELRQLDLYDFEKTCANYIYKPVTRDADGKCEIVIDEDYFLNSALYRDKYIDMDQYFLNVCNTAYTSYNKNYGKTSDGRVQIFFRFHQWNKGTSIPAFDAYPAKYVVENLEAEVVLPTTHTTYTINDAFKLDPASSKYTFLGWYLDPKCNGEKIEEIKLGSSGNIILYAKWDITD